MDAGHTVDVVYIKPYKVDSSLTVAIKVSPAVRLCIINEQGGRLFLGDRSYPIKDRYYVKVCYHCQGIGHISSECKKIKDDSCCLYCSGAHKSATCIYKRDIRKRNCARCSNSNVHKFSTEAHTHNAASPDCPMFLKEAKRLENNTELFSKNVM